MCNVGNNIKKYRKIIGLTQEQLGTLSGLSTMSIRRYESNDRKPNIEQLRKISNTLGVSLGSLLEGNFKEYVDEIKNDFSSSGKKMPQSIQIEVPDELGERIEEVKKILSTNPKDLHARTYARQVLNDIALELGYDNDRDFIINQIKMNINDLNEKGLRKVLELTQDLILIKDYLLDSKLNNNHYLEPVAAHERTDTEVTSDMVQTDDDIMDNSKIW